MIIGTLQKDQEVVKRLRDGLIQIRYTSKDQLFKDLDALLAPHHIKSSLLVIPQEEVVMGSFSRPDETTITFDVGRRYCHNKTATGIMKDMGIHSQEGLKDCIVPKETLIKLFRDAYRLQTE